MIRNLRLFIGKRYNAFTWLLYEYKLLINHLGSSDREKTKEKIKANLIIESHVIEKGLSFRDVKVGFRENKIIDLLDTLNNYFLRFSDRDFCTYILIPIKKYIDFNLKKGHKNSEIIEKFEKLTSVIKPDFSMEEGGVISTTRKEIHEKALIDFEGFVNLRFSIRDFSDEPVNFDLIRQAIKIAMKTPSACNRQPWRVHLIKSKEHIINILDYQTGARQFKQQIGCVILVTSTYNSFFGGEFHQPYVNGGLYAMTLIYALHSMGFGTIPLNMGFPYKKLKRLSEFAEVSEDEVPILLIGIGNIPDQLNVAYSSRFNFQEITKEY
ncbi:MAG: nitroreductase family protein [Bacteroidales bacterium]|nr:nitroreductase family protein [Bacteroidales bacterium]MCF8390267.1 nitroreductase family protein [Bacteroidales bacterium]